MLKRRSEPTKWVWCFIVLSSGLAWSPANSVNVPTPAKIPSTIEAQAKFFQDFFSVQLSPYKIEFGHVCEDPNTWEQRYEKKDFKNHRDMGKVRWGDKKGGYGEHYWDLNHAGHAGNEETEGDYDDGSYNEELQDYPEKLEQSNKYEAEEYDPDASEYEKSARPKRENSNLEIQSLKGERNYEEEQRVIQKRSNKDDSFIQFKRRNNIMDRLDDFDRNLRKTNLKANRQKRMHEQYHEKNTLPSEKHHVVLVVNHKVKDNYEDEEASKGFVPYEPGRKHYNRQVAPALVPRLFLESSTGHVIDRATGHAYILQPVNRNNN